MSRRTNIIPTSDSDSEIPVIASGDGEFKIIASTFKRGEVVELHNQLNDFKTKEFSNLMREKSRKMCLVWGTLVLGTVVIMCLIMIPIINATTGNLFEGFTNVTIS